MDVFELHVPGPHDGARVLVKGNVQNPKQALILLHGRGSSAENISRATKFIDVPVDTVVLAPTAVGNAWYPSRFLVSREENEPHLTSSLDVIEALLEHCKKSYGLERNDIVLAGFSQGACLTADFAARNPARYKGLCIWSGGLIGDEEDIEKTPWHGDLEQTDIYMSCDKNDAHIPAARVEATAKILGALNGNVSLELYDSLGHSIHPDGYAYLRQLLHL